MLSIGAALLTSYLLAIGDQAGTLGAMDDLVVEHGESGRHSGDCSF
jgi:hypothetical protein